MVWRWVAKDVVLAIHDRQIAEHGGTPGIRDVGLVDSALARPQNLDAYGQPDVADLAAAHVAALHLPMAPGGFEALNVGTGRGQSVLEVIRAVERALGHPLPWSPGARRAGAPACLVADPARAMRRLGWSPPLSSLDEIVATAARWHENPRYGPGAKVF